MQINAPTENKSQLPSTKRRRPLQKRACDNTGPWHVALEGISYQSGIFAQKYLVKEVHNDSLGGIYFAILLLLIQEQLVVKK